MIQKCPEKNRLAAFAVGEVNEHDLEFMIRHLDQCKQCEQSLSDLDQVDDVFVDRLRILDQPAIAWKQEQAVAECERATLAQFENRVSCDLSFDAGKHYSRLLDQGTCRLGRFELIEEVGVGSFGHVFRATDTELDRIVAVKIQRAGAVATDEEAKRFLREAQSTASLKHPLIVSLFDTGQTDEGVCFLVTEFVESETLESVLKNESISFSETAGLIAQMADALEYAHQQGVIHRDIKPSNILIDGERKPHVTDFGLAKRDSTDTALTSDGLVMGTPAYMSPEVARGASNQADARSDIYSLGVILFEMLTGEPPFQGTKRLLLLQVLEDEPRSPRALNEKIPRDLETICLKAMSKTPNRRYASAKDLAGDLRCFLEGEPISARPVSRLERFGRWCKKYPFAAALLFGITFSSIAGFAYLKALNTWFVEEMALDNARLYSDMMEEFNATYSDVRREYMTHGDPVHNPPPLPATMQIEVAERISCENAMEVRIFSEHSFRDELRPRDDFERKALRMFDKLIQNPPKDPSENIWGNRQVVEGEVLTSSSTDHLEHFQFIEIDDRPYLKYARAQVMAESCIECHNNHVDSPKVDWKTGDLAGVFMLTRPLDRDIQRARSGFQGASLLMLSIAVFLTTCGFVLAYQLRRKTLA